MLNAAKDCEAMAKLLVGAYGEAAAANENSTHWFQQYQNGLSRIAELEADLLQKDAHLRTLQGFVRQEQSDVQGI